MTNSRSHTKSVLASWLSFVGLSLIAIAIFALVLVVMGTRWEHMSLDPAKPTPTEQARQNTAVTIARTHTLAQELQNDALEPTIAAIIGDVATASDQWLTSLGDVWVPWPDGAPEGYSNPELDLTPKEVTVDALRNELIQLSSTLPADTNLDGRIATSISVKARTLAAQLSPNEEREQSCHTPDLSQLGSHITGEQTLLRLESARQWLEHYAAIADPAQRQHPEEQIALLTALTENMIDAGTPDSRPALVPPASSEDVTAALTVANAELIDQASQATPEEREATVSFLCLLSAGEQLPALPGTATK
ncbi:hypothetical protein [Arcanobacterium phocae]|uniref:hypothetical protein n=1 Tax=Arcanobacterium phocae TaxID=131112 RepID=UPI001C0EAF80|nr:hypothetical protein [Arcanobacterium phocae]